MENKDYIDDNLLAAYAEGRTDAEETMRVVRALASDPRLREALFLIRCLDGGEEGREIPMERLAAAAGDGLCDVLCEQRILRDFLAPEAYAAAEAHDNMWLRDEGMPLHAVGRMLERHGMSVSRQYDATEADLLDSLERRCRLIAVVDAGSLSSGMPSGTLHAVVVLALHDGLMRLYDPAEGMDVDMTYEQFSDAWTASRNYLVTACPGRLTYRPHPIYVDDVDLDGDLLELTEAIAENAHEVWASQRASEGWTWGEERDDARKLHPDMVPYSDLPEGEKEYDRIMAFNTLRLVKKLGFKVSREGRYRCGGCNAPIDSSMLVCPYCGKQLGYSDFE